MPLLPVAHLSLNSMSSTPTDHGLTSKSLSTNTTPQESGETRTGTSDGIQTMCAYWNPRSATHYSQCGKGTQLLQPVRKGDAITVVLLPTHQTTKYTSHRSHAVLRKTHNESIHCLALPPGINRRTTHHRASTPLVTYIRNPATLHQQIMQADT